MLVVSGPNGEANLCGDADMNPVTFFPFVFALPAKFLKPPFPVEGLINRTRTENRIKQQEMV
jgi:hypothetical protein